MPDKKYKTSMSIEAAPAKPKTFSDNNLDLGYGLGGANNYSTKGAKSGGSITPEQNATPKMDTSNKNKLVSMKKGGPVPKTGPYKLHEGEYVVPADKVKQMADKEPKMWPSSETRLIMPQATEAQKAAMTTQRGKQAAQIKDPDEKKKYISDSADVDKDYDAVAQSTAIKGNELQKQAVMGSMKKGGTVPKTGPYKLHKGEKVIPADKVKTMASKMADATKGLGAPEKAPRAKKAIHMHIEPTDNKGFIVHHHEHENGQPTGKVKHHVFTKAGDMHKHVAKTFPMPAAEAAAPALDAVAPAAPAAPPAAAAPAVA